MEMHIAEKWTKENKWSWREFLALMLLEFGGVVWFVKHGLQPLYEAQFDNSLYAGALTGLTIAVILLTGLYLIALGPLGLSWNQVGIRCFPSSYWGKIILWFLILTILSIAAVIITGYMGNTVDNSKTEALREQVNGLTVCIGILSAGVISPVYEEIFYRGFIYRWLRTRTGKVLSLLISSLIFTVAHYPTLNAMPVNFISGIIFAWTYERTGSVWPAILIHGAFNSIAVILTALS